MSQSRNLNENESIVFQKYKNLEKLKTQSVWYWINNETNEIKKSRERPLNFAKWKLGYVPYKLEKYDAYDYERECYIEVKSDDQGLFSEVGKIADSKPSTLKNLSKYIGTVDNWNLLMSERFDYLVNNIDPNKIGINCGSLYIYTPQHIYDLKNDIQFFWDLDTSHHIGKGIYTKRIKLCFKVKE